MDVRGVTLQPLLRRRRLYSGALNLTFLSVRSFVRPSAAAKIKTVTDETIKTCQKSRNFQAFSKVWCTSRFCVNLFWCPKMIKKCRFTNWKTIQKGAKNTLKSSDFLCFDAEMARKTDVTLCPTTRFRSWNDNFLKLGQSTTNLDFMHIFDIFGPSAPHAPRV